MEGVEMGVVFSGVVGNVGLGGVRVGSGVCPTRPEESLAMSDVFSVSVTVLIVLELVHEKGSAELVVL